MSIFYDTAKYRALDAMNGNFLPPSMDEEDCFQDAILYMLEHPDKPKCYYEAVLPKEFLKKAQKLRTGPGASIRHYHKSKGTPLNFGEVSIEVFASDGKTWEDFMSERQDDDVYEVSFFTLTIEEATECLKDIRSQQKKADDSGISWAKTRGKYHLECAVRKRKQFIGQYITIEEARDAKKKFLGDLMDAILDAVETQGTAIDA
jgi:hypothetical protein